MKDPVYLQTLIQAFKDLHGCKAAHMGSTAVLERFQGKIVWDGCVEVFALSGHPQATMGYAWSPDRDKKETVTTVLRIPPVVSAQDAVKAAIVASTKPKA